ncbi:intracellular coagulation inhibitor 1-like isoform X1 [Tachypleus tridentatus]|uniref:intracellular coagulation inhibitor 1-like isoform X1 n=2 Tax=Tachypleus tridentatus TaxID=6853 RepID=UPI003FD652D4
MTSLLSTLLATFYLVSEENVNMDAVLLWTILVSVLAFCDLVVSQEETDVVKVNNQFAFTLLKSLDKRDNFFISPWSLSVSLGMAYLGASGGTAREMEDVLGYRSLGIQGESLHNGFKEEQNKINSIKEQYQLSSVNAVLLHKGYTISKSYSDGLEVYYKSSLKEVDFTDPDSVLQWANAWGYWASRSSIQNLMTELPSKTTKLLLLNGVYFKGKWLNQFDPKNTQEGSFTTEDGEEVVVPIMYQTFNISYVEYPKLDTYAVNLPYKDKELSMIVLLPSMTSDLKTVEKGLTTAILDDILAHMTSQQVKVGLPKFELKYNHNMKEALKGIGMRSAFKENRADFSGITGKRDLYIEEVVHQAVIQVSEEGTVAAANSVVQIGNRRKPLELIINRPFIFFIRDNRSGIILFMGRVVML